MAISASTSTRILIIEDETNITTLLSAYLQAEGYAVYVAHDGIKGLALARQINPNLLILDLMLPGQDGLTVLQTLREESDVYVLILTARADEQDKIVGLGLGADDYLTKPFSPRELVARVQAALRRLEGKRGQYSDLLVFGTLRIDLAGRRVWQADEIVELTPLEFDLLRTLAQHPGRVLSRSQLLSQVWGHDFFGDERVVDVHLGRIRKKIEVDSSRPRHIVTVRGVGYRFEGEAS